MPESSLPEYQQGHLIVDLDSLAQAVQMDPAGFQDCTFGIQVNYDGRVWICVNSVTFLRFKPKVPHE